MSGNVADPGQRAWIWQYLVVDATTRTKQNIDEVGVMQHRCNELGAQGWELVSAVPVARSYGATHGIRLFFKRPAPAL